MKKFLSLFLVFVLSVSFLTPVYATTAIASPSNNTGVISFECYDAAVKAEYAKYHVKYECINYNKDFVFTQKLLDQKLQDINDTLSSFMYDTETNSFMTYVQEPIQHVSDKHSSIIESAITPYAAYVILNKYFNVVATSPSGLGNAHIEIAVNTTQEVQSSSFVTINSCTSRQYGSAVNFKSWSDDGNTLKINSTRKWVSGNVYGTLVVQYTEPNTGITATYTSDHGWNIGFQPM